ncbi:MAG: hypothetical protein JXQ87_02990 [Bacteroidia bacterium]
MKSALFIFSMSLLTGCATKVPVNSNIGSNSTTATEIRKTYWTAVEPQIQGAKLKEDFELFFLEEQVFMIPASGCIVEFNYDKTNNKLNKKKSCESLIYEITTEGLSRMPEIPLDEKPTSLTKWNGKLLLAAQKSESNNGGNPVTHIIIYELDSENNMWKVFAPYGFTKAFYSAKKGNGLTHVELGGITGGPLYLIYGDPYLKMLKYENEKWGSANTENGSKGGISGQNGQIIENKFYYSFQDYGHDNTGPRIKQVDSNGELIDLGGFPITKATNSNVSFTGDGENYMLLTGNARAEGEKFGKYEIRTLNNGIWEILPTNGLPDNLTHYWSHTFNGEHYISARIAPANGSVYQAKASVYKFSGTSWLPVGNINFTSIMPNYPKVFALKGKLYCIYNQKDGGYTLMNLND